MTTYLLTVVIPIYNERATLAEVMESVHAIEIKKEIIAVDDGSTDGSRELLKALAEKYPDVRALYHERNRGKGAALRTGFRHANGDVVICQDADLECDPQNYPQLLKPLLDGRADVLATDVDEAALAIARRGTYSDLALGAVPDAMLWHYVHDISRTPAALDNLFAQCRPGTRLAIAGMKFFPWWLAPLNLLAWLKNMPYNVHAHELHEPWSRVAPRLDGFAWEATQWGMGYIGSGVVKVVSMPAPATTS